MLLLSLFAIRFSLIRGVAASLQTLDYAVRKIRYPRLDLSSREVRVQRQIGLSVEMILRDSIMHRAGPSLSSIAQ
jgi:hypothetical protein